MVNFLKCLWNGGHIYGRWWWPNRPEAAHRVCECCHAMQTTEHQDSWWFRERNTGQRRL